MKAARLHKFGEPLKVEDIPIPEVGPSDVLVQVKACGICGTDVHICDGNMRVMLPLTLGHEPAGIVTEIGEAVRYLQVGDRVCVDSRIPCGQCFYCLKGRENLCQRLRTIGGEIDGGLAEYVKAPETNCFRLPDEIPFDQGAIITDAVTSTFLGVSEGNVQPGDSVAVFGMGGLGIHAIQFARGFGAAKVIAVDRNDFKLDIARSLGADDTVNMARTNPVKEIKALTNGEGVDVAMEIIGVDKTIQQSIECVRSGGKAILMGICPTEAKIKPYFIVMKGIEIKGVPANRRQDFPIVIEMVCSGKIDLSKSITHRVSLDQVNEGLDILRNRRDNPLRVVIIFE